MPTDQDRIVRIKEVLHRTGLHRATLYRYIKAGQFPPQIKLGHSSAGWYESEVAAWVRNPTGWGGRGGGVITGKAPAGSDHTSHTGPRTIRRIAASLNKRKARHF